MISLRKISVLKFFTLFLPLISASYIVTAQSVAAQSVQTSVQFNNRANQLISLFNKQLAYDNFFTPNFLQAVPVAQLDQIINNSTVQYGAPISVTSIAPNTINSGIIKLRFERATATIEMVVDNREPYKVAGLLIQNFEVSNDDYSAIQQEISVLPAIAGYAVHRLDKDQGLTTISQYNANHEFAIASTFKLYILAELAAQIKKGKREWSDIASLTPKSATIGGTQYWPERSPLTLQSLATLMISISDNNATDALIAHIGRENIESRIEKIGHSNADRTIPLLTTAENFTLKMKANDTLRRAYLQANENQQFRLLRNNRQRLTINNYNAAEFGNGPLYINEVEWFATHTDIARLMNYLQQSRDPVIRQILSINAGIGLGDIRKWQYVGYKGGSEPGVISMSFLVQSQKGQWYSVTGSWNNPSKEVNQNIWISIMTRILNITSKQ